MLSGLVLRTEEVRLQKEMMLGACAATTELISLLWASAGEDKDITYRTTAQHVYFTVVVGLGWKILGVGEVYR